MIYQGSVQHHGTLTPKSLLLWIKYSLSLMRRCVRWLRSGLITHSHRITDSRPPKLNEPVSTMPFSSHSLKTERAWQQSITQGPVVFLSSLQEGGQWVKTNSQRMLHSVACSFFKLFHFYGCVWTPVCGCLWGAEEGVWSPAVASCSRWVPLLEQRGLLIADPSAHPVVCGPHIHSQPPSLQPAFSLLHK